MRPCRLKCFWTKGTTGEYFTDRAATNQVVYISGFFSSFNENVVSSNLAFSKESYSLLFMFCKKMIFYSTVNSSHSFFERLSELRKDEAANFALSTLSLFKSNTWGGYPFLLIHASQSILEFISSPKWDKKYCLNSAVSRLFRLKKMYFILLLIKEFTCKCW